MIDFSYLRSKNLDEASQALAANAKAKIIGGGTNLLDLMKSNVMQPRQLIDINPLAELKNVSELPDGGLRIGALVTNADAAYHPEIEDRYPLLSKAILAGASPQLRNMATTGGNLLQRTRCHYFYDIATPCNKRESGSGCSAIDGWSRMHAVLGTSEDCIAVHPSDMCVALAALEAVVQVKGSQGDRSIAFQDFHRLPGRTPERDNVLARDEIIIAVDLPPLGFAKNFSYLKIRDRSSYAFALVSVAVGIEFDGDRIKTARIALGGVAHKPWRDLTAESLLAGKRLGEVRFSDIADVMLFNAAGYGENDFKIPLAKKAIQRALEEATAKETLL